MVKPILVPSIWKNTGLHEAITLPTVAESIATILTNVQMIPRLKYVVVAASSATACISYTIITSPPDIASVPNATYTSGWVGEEEGRRRILRGEG